MAATMGLQREISSRLAPDEALQRYLALVSDSFRKSKWAPINQSSNSLTFGKEQFHTWQIVVAILLFPFGLLALLGEKQHHWVTAMFVERESGTAIAVTGAVPGDSQIEAMLDHVQLGIDADPNLPQATLSAT